MKLFIIILCDLSKNNFIRFKRRKNVESKE